MLTYKPKFDIEERIIEAKIRSKIQDFMNEKNDMEERGKIFGAASVLLFLVLISVRKIICMPSFLWIYAICGAIFGFGYIFSLEKLLRILIKPASKKLSRLYDRYISIELEYIFDNETVSLKTKDNINALKWSEFDYYGYIEGYVYLVFHKEKRILINVNTLSETELYEFNRMLKQVKRYKRV